MALGEFTKQLAKQAIGDQVAELLEPGKPTKPGISPESPGAVVQAQIQAMQRSLKEDQELAVLVTAGAETIRVVEFYQPAPFLLVLTGHDSNRNLTRVITPAVSTQLVCKVVKVQPGAAPLRIHFVAAKTS